MATRKISTGLIKLKSLIPQKKPYIIWLPDELEDGLHWLFWVLIVLVITFLVSMVVINYTDLPQTLSLLF
ncbi:MAG: hypothetical protein V1807_01970 [Patescibacteria group bacterium]